MHHFRRLGLLVPMASLMFIAPPTSANPVISYGVEAGQPATETVGGVSVAPMDAVDVSTATLLFAALPAGEDLDALHILDNGNVLFSTTTGVTLGGVAYDPGDVIEFDGVNFSLLFDHDLLTPTYAGIDAVSVLPNGNLLVSTVLSATIFGQAFLNGDVIEVDLGNGTAGLYMGLNEAAIFTGTNADIDALHYDVGSGNLILSVRAAHTGTIGGLTVTGTDAHTDLFELDLSSGVSGSLHQDGAGLLDGSTRQLDAVFLIIECDDAVDNDGDGLVDDGDDPGCESSLDSSEHSADLPCDDGVDNDGDQAIDYPNDPGCGLPIWVSESPQCSDGINNGDADGLIDFDGGAQATGGPALTAPDPQCVGKPHRDSEHSASCGLGFELVWILPAAAWAYRRRRARRV